MKSLAKNGSYQWLFTLDPAHARCDIDAYFNGPGTMPPVNTDHCLYDSGVQAGARIVACHTVFFPPCAGSSPFTSVVFALTQGPQELNLAWLRMRQALSTLAGFLAVEESALEAMLTQRVVVTRGETFTKQLGLEDANLTRDAIVKSLYEVS